MAMAAIPASKERAGLVRSDDKRLDGLSLIPWREGRCLVWDVTVADTTAASYLYSTSVSAGSAAESAARRKETKYTELSHRYEFEFVPIAMDTHGPLDTKAASFLVRTYKRIVMSLRVPVHVISLTVASEKQPRRATVQANIRLQDK
jgi:hypothetical protein